MESIPYKKQPIKDCFKAQSAMSDFINYENLLLNFKSDYWNFGVISNILSYAMIKKVR